MSFVSPEEEEKLVAAVKDAGDELMKRWVRAEEGTLEIEHKPDGTRVTEADMASDKILREFFGQTFPEDTIVSEEDPKSHGEVKGRAWVMDPLDGTNSYIWGSNEFSILVALVDDHIPVFGIMYFPAREELVIVKKGEGIQYSAGSLQVSKSDVPRPGSVYVRRFKPHPSELLYEGQLDSGMGFLELCKGSIDGILLKGFGEWDLAVTSLMVEESGGKVTNLDGSPVRFTTGESPTFIAASNGLVHDQVIALVPESEK